MPEVTHGSLFSWLLPLLLFTYRFCWSPGCALPRQGCAGLQAGLNWVLSAYSVCQWLHSLFLSLSSSLHFFCSSLSYSLYFSLFVSFTLDLLLGCLPPLPSVLLFFRLGMHLIPLTLVWNLGMRALVIPAPSCRVSAVPSSDSLCPVIALLLLSLVRTFVPSSGLHTEPG